jgi:DNA processing protein
VVGMVGARNASASACRFARGIAAELGERGVTVASGLARGIDTAAHQGSIEAGTVAVIAGGIDVAYPPENADLQERIANEGLLIAEQPPGIEPRARHFPYRNRIIAGLAQAVLVVEAAPKSGSLITARYAGEYGREVLAVPGSPLDPRAQGCNLLIREGATLVQTADDVMETIRPIDPRMISEPISPYSAPVHRDAEDADRRAVTELLGPVPTPVDEIVRQSGRPPAIVQTVLLELELAGRLERHAGGQVSLA